MSNHGVNFIVNTVQNAKEEILGVYAGDMLEAYGRTLAYAKKAMTAGNLEPKQLLFFGGRGKLNA